MDGLASPAVVFVVVLLMLLVLALLMPRGRPLCEFAFPLLGHNLQLMAEPLEFVLGKIRKFGDTFTVDIFLRRTTMVVGERGARALLKHDSKSVHVEWPVAFQRLLGPLSPAVQMPADNARSRKLYVSAFAPKNLGAYTACAMEITRDVLRAWATRDFAFDVHEDSKRFAFNIATTFLFRTRYAEAEMEAVLALFTTWLEGFRPGLPLDVPVTYFGKGMAARRQLLAHFKVKLDEVTKERAAAAGSSASSYEGSALSSMLDARDEQGEALSEEALLDSMLTLLFAGHDTTTLAIGSLIHFLCADSPEARGAHAKLRAELDAAWDGSTASLTYELLSSLPALDCVLKEVMRMTPPVGLSFRTVTNPVEVDGVSYQKGECLGYSIIGANYLADVFPEPRAFRPDRFAAADAVDKTRPYAYLPFGSGPGAVYVQVAPAGSFWASICRALASPCGGWYQSAE